MARKTRFFLSLYIIFINVIDSKNIYSNSHTGEVEKTYALGNEETEGIIECTSGL